MWRSAGSDVHDAVKYQRLPVAYRVLLGVWPCLTVVPLGTQGKETYCLNQNQRDIEILEQNLWLRVFIFVWSILDPGQHKVQVLWTARSWEGDQFHVPGSDTVQRWHLLRRHPHQDCFSNGGYSQMKVDLEVQYHQLRKQVQVVQVSCHLHLPVWLWNVITINTDPSCWIWKTDPGFRHRVPEKTSPHLLLRTQDQQLGVEQDHKINDWVWSKINFLMGPLVPLRQVSGDGNLNRSGISHATTASPKTPFWLPRGWAAPWPAEEMLDGQRHGVDIPAHGRTVHKGLL